MRVVSAPDRGAQLPTAREVADDLLQRIRSDRRAVGDPLDSDELVAVHYGVSKDVARRAWMHLAKEGFVERRHGRGTFVADKPPVSLEERVAALERWRTEVETRGNHDTA
jgi:DNA-binding GntR family transcriptional regulator